MSPQSSTLAESPKLSEIQVEQFIRDGYVVVPGLIEPEIGEKARQILWDTAKIDPADRATWPENPVLAAVEAHELMAFCRVPAMEEVAEQLAGPHFKRGGGFVPVVNFPTPGPREFVPLRAHIDGINETTVWPVQRYAVILAYLSDTTEYGGALAVWPSSHRTLLAHWVRTGTGPLGNTTPPPLDYGDAVPVAAKAGDVVFMHYLLVHASSENHDDQIRIAINGTIKPDPIPTGYPKAGPPQPDWTPIDYTLRTDNLTA